MKRTKPNPLDRKNFYLTISVAVALFFVAIFIFTFSSSRITVEENRGFLINDATVTAENIDSAITEGYHNIKILSSLVSNSLTGPEFDISVMQGLVKDSVFDFMEFADKDGMDHNITGGVSDARDRQYYLDAKAGNSGMELIYVSRATGETLLMFYSPVYYEEEFVGSLVGVYQASNRITKLLSSTYFGEPAKSYLANEEGRVIASNLGFDPETVMYVNELAEGRSDSRESISNALKTGETVTFSVNEQKTGGCMVRLPESGWYLVELFPEKVSNQTIQNANVPGYRLVTFLLLLYAGIIYSLIHFYRRQQKQVDSARIQAEEASKAKTRFLFSMSHDIRTPMNAILGFTNMGLKNIDDKEKVEDCLNKTLQSGNLLLKLINSVLDMSRIESGTAPSKEEAVDIYQSFSSIESTLVAMGKASNVEVGFSFGNISDRYVYADRNLCARVFTNLITNAVKYSNEGGYVKVRCEQAEPAENGIAFYRYTVEDNGIGMSEEFQKHMFEAFAREETATISGIQGTGLGLSVCQSMVDSLGGIIECESTRGKGTTFTVMLPLRLCAALPGKETPQEQISPAFEGLCCKKALLVEDNELNRELARDILEDEHIEITEAVNGEEAVKKVDELGPDYFDFILMDIQMPVMDGYQATRLIREKYPDKKLPIIALSANAFEEDKAASKEAGMNDHIAKPIEVTELFKVIMKCMNNN